MKRGCYMVDDQRSTKGTITPVALAAPEFIDPDGIERTFMVGVRFWNLAGEFYHYVPVDLEHPDFTDDEQRQTMVIGTPEGNIYLRWPTQADYDNLAGGAPEGIVFPDVHTDAERQAFLESIMCKGQL